MSHFSLIEGISLKNLLDGIGLYLKKFLLILKNPFRPPSFLPEPPRLDFGEAVRFVIYSISIGFFILLPSYFIFNVEVHKWAFFLRFVFNVYVFGFVLHYASKIFDRAGRTLRDTYTMYFYFCGFGMVCAMVCLFVPSLYLGPMVVLGGVTDIEDLTFVLLSNRLLYYYFIGFQIVIPLVSLVVTLTWLSNFYKISKFKVIFVLFFTGLPLGLATVFLINPFFNFVGSHIEKVVGAIL